jgi:hypothetical protein
VELGGQAPRTASGTVAVGPGAPVPSGLLAGAWRTVVRAASSRRFMATTSRNTSPAATAPGRRIRNVFEATDGVRQSPGGSGRSGLAVRHDSASISLDHLSRIPSAIVFPVTNPTDQEVEP